MRSKDAILREIEQMPESRLDDVLIFVRSLKAQKQQIDLEICLLSEGALVQDWLKVEEEAWQDL